MEEKWEGGFGEVAKSERTEEQKQGASAEGKQEASGSAEQKQEGAQEQGPQEEAAPPARIIKPRSPGDPKATHSINGSELYAEDEIEEVLRQRREQREANSRAWQKLKRAEWIQSASGKLCLELYEKFQQYKKYVEEHAAARWMPGYGEVEFDEHKLFERALTVVEQCREDRAEKNRKNLERAQMAARCQHTHLDGKRCRAPRVRGKKLCRMHQRIEDAAAAKFDLGPMEDPDSIQLSIMKLQRGLIDGSLPSREVGQLAYLIQLAAWNVTRTSFAKREEPEGADGHC